jgi:hypothetical protein
MNTTTTRQAPPPLAEINQRKETERKILLTAKQPMLCNCILRAASNFWLQVCRTRFRSGDVSFLHQLQSLSPSVPWLHSAARAEVPSYRQRYLAEPGGQNGVLSNHSGT